MATQVKEFHFRADTEGWSAVPAHGYINMAWFPPHKNALGRANIKGHFDLPPIYTMGGCLRTTACRTSGSAENAWLWSGTWEDLGVPAGESVDSVSADYIWRIFQRGHRQTKNSTAEWGVGECGSGPFELLDGSLSVISTFSARSFAPAHSVSDPPNYPMGSGADSVSFTPPAWKHEAGAVIAVPGAQRPSGSTIKLHLRSLTPACADDRQKWVRLKQDYVRLTIQYSRSSVIRTGMFL